MHGCAKSDLYGIDKLWLKNSSRLEGKSSSVEGKLMPIFCSTCGMMDREWINDISFVEYTYAIRSLSFWNPMTRKRCEIWDRFAYWYPFVDILACIVVILIYIFKEIYFESISFFWIYQETNIIRTIEYLHKYMEFIDHNLWIIREKIFQWSTCCFAIGLC